MSPSNFAPTRIGGAGTVYGPGSKGYEGNKVLVGVDFNLIAGNIIGGVKEGVKEGAEIVLSMAKEIVARGKTGDLAESGRVITKQTGEFIGSGTYNVEPTSTVVFGSTKVFYAAIHENWLYPDYINPTTPGTRPRFLKIAVRQAKDMNVVTEAIRRRVSYAMKHGRSAWKPRPRTVTKP